MSWASIKHAVNGTLGTSSFKPLDVILKNQTDIKVQYVSFSARESSTKTIEAVDVSRTIIVPISQGVPVAYFSSRYHSGWVRYRLENSTTVRCTQSDFGDDYFVEASVMVITFGASVAQ